MEEKRLRALIGLLREEGVSVYQTPELTLHLYERHTPATITPQTPAEMKAEAEREAKTHDAILFAAVGGPPNG